MTWDILENACRSCTRCRLSENRTNVVIGRGHSAAPVLFVGEGPGRQEDEQGLPFVGQAGALLDLACAGLNFAPEDYYIANVVKCRPPENRTPLEDECTQCLPFLRNQFALIKPRIVVCLGNVPLHYLIDKDARITQVRGQWIERKGVWFTATYHPAALLRDESKKLDFWRDLEAVKQKLTELRGGM
ncbi:MAG: uracil-DNA glycosylase [Clostridia bacterium]|nr:uracil-DNA glycosylase [Clostridia bacterium]